MVSRDLASDKDTRNRAILAELRRATLAAAIAQREAYDRWLVENAKDIGESLANYGSKTEGCLKAARELMKAEAKLKERTK